MTLQEDFNKVEGWDHYKSKERFWFENAKVSFWYRIYLEAHTYQPGWNDEWETRYQVSLIVDEESIHANHVPSGNFFDIIRFGFLLKETTKRGKFNETDAEKIVNSALKLKIENKIKVMAYQKILGIVNGTKFYV